MYLALNTATYQATQQPRKKGRKEERMGGKEGRRNHAHFHTYKCSDTSDGLIMGKMNKYYKELGPWVA
jgi:hypothetical protein